MEERNVEDADHFVSSLNGLGETHLVRLGSQSYVVSQDEDAYITYMAKTESGNRFDFSCYLSRKDSERRRLVNKLNTYSRQQRDLILGLHRGAGSGLPSLVSVEPAPTSS
jgi:hypothetical protein